MSSNHERQYLYMAYQSFDMENHSPIGIYDDLNKLIKDTTKRKYIYIYKIRLNEIFDLWDLNQIEYE